MGRRLRERFLSSSARDLRTTNLYKATLAEALGTALLVLIVNMSVVTVNDGLGVSLAIGLTLASLVWVLGGVSGAHINPAISLAMLAARRISLVRFALYVAAQCAGGALGVVAARALTCDWQSTMAPQSERRGCFAGVPRPGSGVSELQAFAVETLIAFAMLLVVSAASDASRQDLGGSSGPLAAGLVVTGCHLATAPLTGAIMNPAGTLGPAVITGTWEHHWIYWTGPMTGAVTGALVYELLLAGDASWKKFGDWLVRIDYGR